MKISNKIIQKVIRSWPKLLIVLILIGGFLAFFALGGNQFLTLESIHANRERLLEYSTEHYFVMVIATMLIYTISTAMSLPGALLLSLSTGFVFGRIVGTLIIVFSATIGASLVFLSARYLFANEGKKRLEKIKIANKIIEGFGKDSFNYLLFLRLVPIFPFWIVNLAPAFTHVKLRTYIIATAVGIVPGSFVFANLGKTLSEIKSLNNLLSTNVIMALTFLGLFSLIPIIFKKRVRI